MTDLRKQINNIVEDYNACKVLAQSVGNPSVYEGTTATKEDILVGKTAYSNGELLTGTMLIPFETSWKQPTENKPKVWIQKSNNLSNISSFSVAGGTGYRYSKTFNNLQGETQYALSFTKSRISGVTISNSALFGAPNIYFNNGSTLIQHIQQSFTTYIRTDESYRFTYTFKTPANCDNMIVYFDNNNGDTNTNITVSDIMLEYGTEAHEYEPYASNVKVYLLDDEGQYQYINMSYDLQELTVIPSNTDQVYTQGYNKVTVQGDENLQAENIRSDIQIFDVTGTYTSDATATAEDIAKDKTAYVNGEKITGSMVNENNTVMNTTLNVPSSTVTNYATHLVQNIKKLPPLDLGTTGYYAFNMCNSLEEVTLLNSSNYTSGTGMFDGCKKLVNIYGLDTSNMKYMKNFFYNCNSLVNIPELNGANIENGQIENMFNNCSLLSDESLNKILSFCVSCVKQTSAGYKKLSYLGLTSDQATKCQSLSNYQAFLNAGWTTGY